MMMLVMSITAPSLRARSRPRPCSPYGCHSALTGSASRVECRSNSPPDRSAKLLRQRPPCPAIAAHPRRPSTPRPQIPIGPARGKAEIIPPAVSSIAGFRMPADTPRGSARARPASENLHVTASVGYRQNRWSLSRKRQISSAIRPKIPKPCRIKSCSSSARTCGSRRSRRFPKSCSIPPIQAAASGGLPGRSGINPIRGRPTGHTRGRAARHSPATSSNGRRRWPAAASSTSAPARASSALPPRRPVRSRSSRPRSTVMPLPRSSSTPPRTAVAITVLGDDLLGLPPPSVDLVAVGDLFYDRRLAVRVTAFLDRCLAAGIDVLIGDPGRAYLPRSRLARHRRIPGAGFRPGRGDDHERRVLAQAGS